MTTRDIECCQRRKQQINENDFQELFDYDTGGPVRTSVIFCAILIFIVLLVLFASGVFESKPTTNNENNSWLMYGLLITVGILTSISILLVILFAIVRGQEQATLFQPQQLRSYGPSLAGSQYFKLPHGGVLLHVNPTAPATARRIYFLHGNSLSLKAYAAPLLSLAALGYSVYALEYSGFGIAKANRKLESPNAVSVIQDAYDGWAVCGDENTIVIGFSLGGAVLGEIYEFLHPRPAQIVFLNAFCNLGAMIESKMPIMGGVVKEFIRTKWKTKCPCDYHGSVLIVFTKDDSVIPSSQGKMLGIIFKSLNPTIVELPWGGHRKSCLIFSARWNPQLLSPILET